MLASETAVRTELRFAPPAVEFVLAGNGPGELQGWIAPVARAVRAIVPGRASEVRLTLALLPSQFAGGRELEVVRDWRLFDRILTPRTCLRAAAGLEAFSVFTAAVLIHLGGDLWLSGRLASRMHRPACALVETTLVARRHGLFARIFAASPALAADLIAAGIPSHKIVATGDPRIDAICEIAATGMNTMGDQLGSRVVAILPGSRDRIFAAAVPYFLGMGAALTHRAGPLRFKIIVSPFVSPSAWRGAREDTARRWPELDVEWVTDTPWPVIRSSDLVITIPGTNTLELAILGVPFVTVVDTELVAVAAIEGVLEWVTRMPGLRALRRGLLLRRLSHLRFAALPNIRLRREVVPELIGRWTAEELAKQVAALLDSPARRNAIRAALVDHFADPPGASRAIVEAAWKLAQTGPSTP
jgi:hypothetical protein